MANLADLRRELGGFADDKSDEQLLQTLASATKRPLGALADEYGYDPGTGSLTGNRLSASVDNYQAGLYETGGSLARGLGFDGLSDIATRRAQDNRTQATVAGERARGLGGIDSFRDVDGFGSGANYLGGLAAQSFPYAAEAVVGGVAGRVLSGAAKTAQVANSALAAAKASGNVAEIATATDAAAKAARAVNSAGMIGGTVASYPSSVGDILSNQREQNGTTDGAFAAMAGVPYAALNGMFGVEGALARGRMNPLREGALDSVRGVKGGVARATAAGGKTALSEGASEVAQEGINQAGRMAVDPRETFINDKSGDRFAESFVGGAALGGAFGAVGNRGRRSAEAQLADQMAARQSAPDASIDTLTESAPLRLDYHLRPEGVDGDIVSFPDGSSMLRGEYDAMVAKGVNKDGSIDFLMAAPSEVMQRRERYDYEGAVPFESVAVPPPEKRGLQLGMPEGAPNSQADMFDPLMDQPNEQQMDAPPATAPEGVDPRTGDLFVQNPTAMGPTAFNPATEPAYNPSNERGAIASNIRSQLAQQVGQSGDMTMATHLSLSLSKVVGNVQAMRAVVETANQQINKNLQALEKKVSGESNLLTPDEYAVKRDALEKKQLTVMAAQELLERFIGQQTNAYAQEGLSRPTPGAVIGKAPGNTTEQAIRAGNADATLSTKIADTDKTGQASMEKQTADDRDRILGDILASNKVHDKMSAFRAALIRAKYRNPTPSMDEMRKIKVHNTLRKDFRKGPVLERDEAVNPEPVAEKQTAPKEPKPAPAQEPKPVAPKQEKPTNANNDDGATEQVPASAATDRGGNTGAGERAAGVTEKDGAGRKRADTTKAVATDARIDEQSSPAEPAVTKRRAALSEDDRATIRDLDEAVGTYNEPAKSDSSWHRKEQEQRAKLSADYIYETANDKHESRAVREYAQKLLDDHVDLKDAEGFMRKNDLASPRFDAPGDVTFTTRDADGNETTETIRYAMGETVPEGRRLTKDAVQKIVDGVRAAFPALPTVVVEPTANDVFGDRVPAGSTAKGASNGKQIFVFSDFHDSKFDVLKTLFHELFHNGLSKVMPKEQYMQSMLKLLNDQQVREYAREWRGSKEGVARKQGMLTNDWMALSVEEALAEIGAEINTGPQTGTKFNSTVRAIASWIADLADAIGFNTLAKGVRRMTMTEAQKYVADTIAVATGEQVAPQRSPYGENYSLLAGKDVTISLPLEDGKTARMTIDAQTALNDIDARLAALDMVRRCLA